MDGTREIDPKLRQFLANLVPPSAMYLRRALELASAETEGFGHADVKRIESFWDFVDAELVSYGYVMSLRHGRRVYLEYTRDDTKGACEGKIEILSVPGSARFPELSNGQYIRWSDDVAYLNEELATWRDAERRTA
jgi:hypothetical protein